MRLDSHVEIAVEIVLDVDATDDPLHGRQVGRFFHDCYDSCCCLPLYTSCDRTDYAGVEAVPGFPLPDAGELEPEATGKEEWLPSGVRGDNQRLVGISLPRGRMGTQPLDLFEDCHLTACPRQSIQPARAFLQPACLQGRFSADDERLAQAWQCSRLKLQTVRRAILLARTRKSMALLDQPQAQPIRSLYYFQALV